MSTVENRLVDALKEVLKERYDLVPEEGFVMVEVPKDSSKGNYATNLAMRLTKLLRRNPREIGQEIKDAMLEKMPEIEGIEIAGPGFINFQIRKDVLANVINEVLALGDDYGKNEAGKGVNILVEYVSANPTGPMHIGNARGGAIGD
ncbi:MAG: arginine--tRNA ligase, partial [Erysipelotrichaceae bacterium]|nr:arginine--tRNA ligase [Erysipelotrichaceae bacterium]